MARAICKNSGNCNLVRKNSKNSELSWWWVRDKWEGSGCYHGGFEMYSKYLWVGVIGVWRPAWALICNHRSTLVEPYVRSARGRENDSFQGRKTCFTSSWEMLAFIWLSGILPGRCWLFCPPQWLRCCHTGPVLFPFYSRWGPKGGVTVTQTLSPTMLCVSSLRSGELGVSRFVAAPDGVGSFLDCV